MPFTAAFAQETACFLMWNRPFGHSFLLFCKPDAQSCVSGSNSRHNTSISSRPRSSQAITAVTTSTSKRRPPARPDLPILLLFFPPLSSIRKGPGFQKKSGPLHDAVVALRHLPPRVRRQPEGTGHRHGFLLPAVPGYRPAAQSVQ